MIDPAGASICASPPPMLRLAWREGVIAAGVEVAMFIGFRAVRYLSRSGRHRRTGTGLRRTTDRRADRNQVVAPLDLDAVAREVEEAVPPPANRRSSGSPRASVPGSRPADSSPRSPCATAARPSTGIVRGVGQRRNIVAAIADHQRDAPGCRTGGGMGGIVGGIAGGDSGVCHDTWPSRWGCPCLARRRLPCFASAPPARPARRRRDRGRNGQAQVDHASMSSFVLGVESATLSCTSRCTIESSEV